MKNKRKKLSNLLLRNYLILYFLTTVIFIGFLYVMSMALVYVDNFERVPSAREIMDDDYKNIDASKIINADGWIEIIDSKLNIVYTYGIPKKKINKYTKKQFFNMITRHRNSSDEMEEEENYAYNFEYNENKDFFLVVIVPVDTPKEVHVKGVRIKPETLFLLTIVLYIITLTVSMTIYAKLSSKYFVSPLKKLLAGVKNITQGDYSTRISLKSKNEFGELRDAFNLMAQKIEEETDLKEKSEETRRKLMMDIAHDLKNPLASVIGYSDLLIKHPLIEEKERDKYLKVIANNGIRANDLIKDLFDFSKLEDIDFKLNFEKKDICEFLRKIIASYIPQMEEKGIEYDFDIPEESIFVLFDDKNLDRAISNLILNAVKYNPTGTKLNVFLKKSYNSVKIVIEDNGIGIPKELEEDIFEPFVRVDSSRNSKSGGTGLGLAISKTIIKKHGGSLKLETELGKGCKFIISLSA